jgi:hypothetical protein
LMESLYAFRILLLLLLRRRRPPFSSKCRAVHGGTPSLLAATKPEPGPCDCDGKEGRKEGEERGLVWVLGRRAVGVGMGWGWVAWGQRWWALREGEEETMRACGGQGHDRAERECARACRARRQTGGSRARRVCPRRAWPRSGCVRSPGGSGRLPLAPARLPAQLSFYPCPVVVKARGVCIFRGKQPCTGHGRRKSPKAVG